MPSVQTRKVPTHANVKKALQVMARINVRTSMNVPVVNTTVSVMPTALTMTRVSPANVLLGIREPELKTTHVQISMNAKSVLITATKKLNVKTPLAPSNANVSLASKVMVSNVLTTTNVSMALTTAVKTHLVTMSLTDSAVRVTMDTPVMVKRVRILTNVAMRSVTITVM
jgi:hypothetical protein